jgi:hypothetical protein
MYLHIEPAEDLLHPLPWPRGIRPSAWSECILAGQTGHVVPYVALD